MEIIIPINSEVALGEPLSGFERMKFKGRKLPKLLLEIELRALFSRLCYANF